MADPGKYRHHLTLYQPTLGAASVTGEQTITGTAIAKMWCSIDPASGREYLAASEVQIETTHIIKTWYRKDVTPNATMWLTHGSRRFDIETVINVNEKNEEFEFRVHEHG